MYPLRNIKLILVSIVFMAGTYSCDYIDTFYEYNKAHLAYEAGDYEKALDHANSAVELDPDNYILYNNRGLILQYMNNHKKAIADFDQSIALDSLFAYSYNNRGMSKVSLGELEDGVGDIRKSLSMDPNNAYAYKNLAAYYIKVDMIDSACYYLEFSEDQNFYEDIETEISEMVAKNCK